LFFAIARELFDRRVAALALLLAAFSPATVVMGATLLSQPISRLFVALYFWALLRALACAGRERAMLYGAIAGLALGYDFNTRPLVAVVCGFASLILLGQAALRVDRPLRILPPLAAMAVTVLAMIGLFLAWNAHLTGDPWLLPYNVLQAGDRMGFGIRGEGYAPLIVDFRINFTPAFALNRIWQHTLPAVLFTAAGWGNYIPNMLLFSDPTRVFPEAAWLLLVPAALIGVALLQTTGRVANLFCGSVFLFTLIALFFQYSDHSTWGSTPLHTSYYSEATLFGLIPLLARGMLIVFDRAGRAKRELIAGAVIAAYAALFANAVHTDEVFVAVFKNWDPYYQLLPRLVDAAKLRNAVVFVPKSRNAPVGEYPFVPLDRANVVYFRTGPLPQWRLDTPDWRTAYRKYFYGRSAYAFDRVSLDRLDTSAIPPPD
jgi:4-amino-4-deoxy-L-arabinose transferase-like glycosyltransferase